MTLPLVSIVLPVYNVSPYLETALDSILNQTYSNYEVIAVNDGSTDNSKIILENYQKQFTHMEIINQKNSGLSVARNVGTSHSVGKYIYYFDPDDILQPNLIEKAVEMMENGHLDIIQFDVETFFDGVSYDPNRILYSYKDISNSGIYLIDDFLNKIKASSFRAPVWQFMYRKSFLEEKQLKFEPSILWEDLLFSPIAVCSANKIGILKEKLYCYRIRQGSITNSKKNDYKLKQREFSSQTIIKKLKQYQEILDSKTKYMFIKKRIQLLLVNYCRDYGYNAMKKLQEEVGICLNLLDYLRIIKIKLLKDR